MKKDITIRPIPCQKQDNDCHIHPLVPQGSCLFIAPSNSGKSTLILNLCLRKCFGILTSYDKIYIFSPTVYDDPSWSILDDYKPSKVKCHDGKKRDTAEIIVSDEYDLDVLQTILDESDSSKRTLVILDDIAPELSKNKVLDRLFFRGRHSGVYCWISSQQYRKVPLSIRLNSPYYVIFRVNQSEANTIADELAVEDKKDFIKTLRKATDPKYGFLTIDLKKSFDERYTSSFKPIK